MRAVRSDPFQAWTSQDERRTRCGMVGITTWSLQRPGGLGGKAGPRQSAGVSGSCSCWGSLGVALAVLPTWCCLGGPTGRCARPRRRTGRAATVGTALPAPGYHPETVQPRRSPVATERDAPPSRRSQPMTLREDLGGPPWRGRTRPRSANTAPPHRQQRRRRQWIRLAAGNATRPRPLVRRSQRTGVARTAG
jgi:hypothetical protein